MDSLEKKEPSKYIQELEAHILSCKEASDYAIKRFDNLIITLSSSGLALSLAFIKDLINSLTNGSLLLFKISTISFTVSIVSNLLSQKTSFFAHNKEIKILKLLILKKQQKLVNSLEIKSMEKKAKRLDSITIALNYTSLISLVTAIILIMVFILNYKK